MSEEKIAPAITVIIAGNATRTCLESVSAQACKDFEFEVIVVGDDPNIDDPRLRIIAGKKNLNAARNAGLNEARGKYVYFVAIDSRLYANGLTLLSDAAETSGADIVRITTFVERDGDDKKFIADQNLLALNLYRREFLERCGLRFPESTDDDEAFMYAAECSASSVETFGRSFYVRDRKKNLRAESEEVYVKDIERDEIRNGFLVTTQRKKLWNAQLKIILEFARICQKYNLKWFAHGGTMLGAVRHKGYVPWDDDVDVGMLRPDYEAFKRIAPSELRSNFWLDAPYNHAIEGEPNEENLPVISLATIKDIRARGWLWPITADFIKLRDNSTTMVSWVDRRHVNQGIWIDILPFDPAPPFEDEKHYLDLEIKKELLMATSYPDVVTAALERGEKTVIAEDVMRRLLKMPFKQRALMYQARMAKSYFESPQMARMISLFFLHEKIYPTAAVRSMLSMPFEEIEVPVPIGYKDMLNVRYGSNWTELIMQNPHMAASTADIPYKKFFEQVSPAIKEFSF